MATLKIKRFRTVNRLYGRAAGDELLEMAFNCINHSLNEGEFISQVNVNYFNILLRFNSDDELVERLISIVRLVRDMPDSRFGGRIFPGLGAYRLTEEKLPFEIAQYNADLCRAGSEHNAYRNGHVEVYGLTFQDPDELFLDPQSKIQPAIESGHIKLFLQPKVNLKTGEINGAEALVRWIDPVKGMIPVKDFLPALNANGLIRNVDLYLFEQVCSSIDRWYRQYGKKINISVNLAGCSFNYAEFFEDYREIFERFNAPKDCIQFELLESIVLNHVERVRQVVDELCAYGFSCALDDFGSGFSSYSILTTTNLSTLKIDRSLFNDANNPKEKTVIKHIIQTARELNMLTVAEGVESQDYVRYLREQGCDFVQGFVFYKPMPIGEFEDRFV
ncbi:MAG: bifunctional diguanylate cyclase/phosphodiesterase, partial [Oscillospiraceae bacterium]